MTKIIGVANWKGGVGKSTISCVLAYQAAIAGEQTLLIDLDEQGDSSSWLMGTQALETETIYSLETFSGLDVVWATQLDEIPERDVLDDYDVVIIDGRPSGVVGGAILGLATFVIMPYTDRTGRKNAQRLADIAECPVIMLQNRIAPPQSGRYLSTDRLIGYERALKLHHWEVVERELYADVCALYEREGVRGTD